MANAPQMFTPEETLNLIAERAKVLAEGGLPPIFDINVSRKNQQTGIPNQIASFSGATLEHITDPIRWLPMLAGGGEYILNVRHPSVQGRIGGPLVATFDKTGPGMESRAVNPSVTRLPNWVGPSFTGPFPEQVNQPAAGATAPTNGLQYTAGYGLPQGLGQTTPAAPVDRERELTAQLADTKAALARIEAESRARTELESERRQNETRLREVEQKADRERRDLEARMQAQVAELRAAATAAPKPDPAAGWQQLITVFMPIVQQMLTSQHETRLAMMKTSDENARRQIEASEKQHQAQMEMIRTITAKPAGMSEEMRLLIETLKADKGGDSASAAMMTRMVEAMGMVSKTSMGMIETIADIQMGDSEHPMVGAIREAVQAMKLLMTGTKEGAQRVVQKQLTQGQQQLTPQQAAQLRAQQQARVQQQQAQARAAQQAGRQTPQKPPAPQAAGPQPVPVTTFVPPAPAVQPPPTVTPSHFQILRAGIEALKPAEEVAEYFISLVKADEPSLSAELGKHGGSPFALLQAEFGQPFIFANKEYFAELGETLDQKGIAAGLWEDDGDDDDGDEDESPEMVTVADGPDLIATIPLDAKPEALPAEAEAAVVV
jgi:hypothetical protein